MTVSYTHLEPQAGAAQLARASFVYTVEAFEQTVQMFGRNADAGIGKTEPEQKQPLNMDKEGFILPDMNITPNDRKPTIRGKNLN